MRLALLSTFVMWPSILQSGSDLRANHVQLRLPELKNSALGKSLACPLQKRFGLCKVFVVDGFAQVRLPAHGMTCAALHRTAHQNSFARTSIESLNQ